MKVLQRYQLAGCLGVDTINITLLHSKFFFAMFGKWQARVQEGRRLSGMVSTPKTYWEQDGIRPFIGPGCSFYLAEECVYMISVKTREKPLCKYLCMFTCIIAVVVDYAPSC